MTTIQDTQQNISEARQTLEAKRKEITEAQGVIQDRIKSLPQQTQRSLRSGGLQGRQQRKQVNQAREDLANRGRVIQTYEGDLSNYEKQIIAAEKGVSDYAKEETAFKLAEKLYYDKNITNPIGQDPLVAKYLYKFDKSEAEARQVLQAQVERIEAENPSEKLIVDYDNLKVTGVSSGSLGQTLSLKDYNKKVEEFNQQLKVSPEIKNIRDSTKYMDRTERTKILNQLDKTSKVSTSELFPIIQDEQNQNVMINTVTAGYQPQGTLETLRYNLKREAERRSQGKKDFQDKTIGLFAGLGGAVLSNAMFAQQLITKPIKTTAEVGKGVFGFTKDVFTGKARAPQIGRLLKQDPTYALGYITGEVIGAKGLGSVAKTGSSLAVKTATFLSPKYKAVDTVSDVIRNIPTSKGAKDIGIAGRISEIAEPIKEQVKLAGQKVDAVSGQRGLFNIFERQKIVDKPLPTVNSPPLEKAFFADPRGRLRPSRLGLDNSKSAGLLDVLSGDVTLKRTKPQALIFAETQVQKFPASLRDIEIKLKQGKPLSVSEQKRFLDFQLKPSGEFKPVGFLSKEPEITLAPGEIIKRDKTVAVTLIEGRRVPIIEASIGQGSKETTELLSKLKKGDISPSEMNKLISKLSKESGIDYSSGIRNSKYLSPASIGASGISLLSSFNISKSSSQNKTTGNLSSTFINSGSSKEYKTKLFDDGYSAISPPSGEPISFDIGSPYPNPMSPISPSPPSSPSPSSPSSPSPSLDLFSPMPKRNNNSILKTVSKVLGGNKQGYDVGIIEKGKKKIIRKGLNRNDALDVGAKRILKDLTATFYIKKSKKKPRDIPDTNVFRSNKQLFRQPKPNSRYKDLGEEVWIQKKRSVGGSGGRLSSKGEVNEIKLFGTNKKKKGKKSIWNF